MRTFTIVVVSGVVFACLLAGYQWAPYLKGNKSLIVESHASGVVSGNLDARFVKIEQRLQAIEARLENDNERQVSTKPQMLPERSEHDDQAPEPKKVQEPQNIIKVPELTNVQEPQRIADVGLSSAACKNAGICTFGEVTEQTVLFKLPPGKYEGAKCEGARLCNFGPRHDAFVGKKDAFQNLADSSQCRKYPQPDEINLIPKWIITSGGNRTTYQEIEEKLNIQDKCVEKMRKQKFATEKPCMRCHGIANGNVLTRIYAELIGRLPRCRRTCETGFNRGDSSIILITSCGHGSQGLSFSLDTRWYTRPGMACHAETLAGTGSTATIVEGYSTTSITDFLARNSGSNDKCDVIMVDGIKSAHGRYQDLADLAPLAHKNTLWITDDVELEGAHKTKAHHCIHKVFYAFAKNQGFEVKCWPTGSGGFMGQCYGYTDWASLLA